MLLVILLAGGLGFFLYEYVTKAETWIVSAGSPHVFNSANIGCGQVVGENGCFKRLRNIFWRNGIR